MRKLLARLRRATADQQRASRGTGRATADADSAKADVARVPAPPPPLPSGEAVDADHAEAFRAALEAASGRFVRVHSEADADAWIAREYQGQRIVDAAADPTEAELVAADVGLDRADLLIAESGTIVRHVARTSVARTTLVPPVSVFRARAEDLVRDLPAALSRIGERHREGRAVTFLTTGPSRTADIEKRLVIPAHGPREVVVLLVTPESEGPPSRADVEDPRLEE